MLSSTYISPKEYSVHAYQAICYKDENKGKELDISREAVMKVKNLIYENAVYYAYHP